MSNRKAFALLITAIMVLGITSPFVFTPVGAVTYTTSPTIPIVLLTPTPNPLRQQWSQLVTNNMQSVGISASRIIADWPVIYDRALLPPAHLGENYSAGGFDALFVGYAIGADSNPYSLFSNTQFAPQSGNYYLWNDSTNEALLNNITQTVDTGPAHSAGMLNAIKQWQAYCYDQMPSIAIAYGNEVNAYTAASNPSGLTVNGSVFAPFQYPLWPAAERFQYTTAPVNSSIVVAQTGPAGSDGLSLSPAHTSSYYDITVYGPIFGEGAGNGLLMRNGGNQPNAWAFSPYMASVMPTVAPNSHLSGSPMVNYTISVRKDIYFQNGEKMDGRDFVWSTRYGLTPTWGSVAYAYAKHLLGTDATGFGNHSVYWAGEPGTPGALETLNYSIVHVNLPAPWAFALNDLFAGSIYPSDVLVNSSSYSTTDLSNWHPTNATTFGFSSTSFGTGLPVAYKYYCKNDSLSVATVGPFGAGPYKYVGYDTSTFVHHLVRWDGYFNKAALVANGFDQIKDYYVEYIAGGTAGVAALKAGNVQILDSQYHLERNLAVLDPAWSGHVSYVAFDVQELGFNMQSPIWGTGVATPLGQQFPSRAAEAAYYVRRAFEYCVPKDAIIKTLMSGQGAFGITSAICTIHTAPNGTNSFLGFTPATYSGATWNGHTIASVSFAIRNESQSDALFLAKQYLKMAGYDIVQVVPPSFWESYGLLLAVVELAVVVVLAGFYFYRPRGGKA